MLLQFDELTVNVEPGGTLLQAARESGVRIPTLCSHETLLPYGACRLCLVELVGPRGGRLVPSCSYPCEENMVVRTHSESVIAARKSVIELLLVTGAHLPVVRSLADEYGLKEPYVSLPPDDCILCGLCVRACRDLVGVGAISLTRRGMDRSVTTPFRISSPDCIECGTCALVCPTGAIRVEDVTRPRRTVHSWDSDFIRLACRSCELDMAGPPFPADYKEFLRHPGATRTDTG